MKHIESILPENVADELTRFLLDDATISSALKDLLHRDTGCDIPSLDNAPTSDIEEIIPLCLSILRRFWNTPLTALVDGTEKQSIAKIFQKVIGDRIQGNEVLSIPPANENIAAAVSALRQRKISGLPEVSDGISLAQVLGSAIADNITEITDTNVGWMMTKGFAAKNYFPNSSKIQLGCGEIRVPFAYAGGVVFDSDEEYKFTALKKITPSTASGFGHGIFNGDVQSHDIDLGDLEEIEDGGFFGLIRCSGSTTDYHYALIARKLKKCPALFSFYNDSQIGITKVVLGKIETNNFQPYYVYGSTVRTPNLIHFEFGEGTGVSLNLTYWSPTTALAERLDEFLSNFKTFIADKVADQVEQETLTLTLSSAVFAALEESQEGQTILATLASKNWNVAQA